MTILPVALKTLVLDLQCTGCCFLSITGLGAPKVALRFASDVAGVPELASAEAFVEFEKNVRGHIPQYYVQTFYACMLW